MELSTLTKIGKVLNFIESGIDIIREVVSPRKSFTGICIPNGCGKSFVSNVLESDEYHIIDLDQETVEDLDQDEKDSILNQNQMKISRLIYSKSKMIIQEVLDILKHSSNKGKSIILVSSDYRLLKYNEASTIYYFMPSDLLVEQLKKEPCFNEKKFQACKQDLIKRKNDKLIIYNSLDELQKIVSTKFNCKLKV